MYRKVRWVFGYFLEKFNRWKDFRHYAVNFSSFKSFERNLPVPDKGTLLLVSGRGMNYVWAQTWPVLCFAAKVQGYKVAVLTVRKDEHLNRYFRLLKPEMIFYEDVAAKFSDELPVEVEEQFAVGKTLSDYRTIKYKNVPVGEIALSTYSRYHGTGVIRVDNAVVRAEIIKWAKILCQATDAGGYLYDTYDVKMLYFTEVFFEEYGPLFYEALKKRLNVIKFTGTVRDDAYILQHLTLENDRIHHASLSEGTWNRLNAREYTAQMDEELKKNFNDRYGSKWHRSKRNHKDTEILSAADARKLLGLDSDRKVAVIYSHILYDSLFFFGTDLFETYANWFVETVRAACANSKVEWFIKVHPSNVWRGELNSLLKGRYEEERLIEANLGQLPPHVHIVKADTKINPYTWFQVADYGITVRGTAGLEMAALGKTVVTAGTGRYEGKGFTVDPKTKEEYIGLIGKLQDIPVPTDKMTELARRYAHALFVLKPVTFTSLVPTLRSGGKEVASSDDISFIPKEFDGNSLPEDLAAFSRWLVDDKNLEMLADYDGGKVTA